MSWKEIGKTINDTLLKGKIKPINKIIENESYDLYYKNSIINIRLNFIAGTSDFLVIPYGVTEIFENEYENSSAEVIILPNTVKKIGVSAFEGSNVRTIIMPPSIKEIGQGAFGGCSHLQDVILPKYIEGIDSTVFEGCDTLSTINIPEYVKVVNNNAFANTGLYSVKFNSKPNIIRANSFASTSIQDIYVPWSEGEVANAPWGATQATIHYNWED